jgi:hypothetical protein
VIRKTYKGKIISALTCVNAGCHARNDPKRGRRRDRPIGSATPGCLHMLPHSLTGSRAFSSLGAMRRYENRPQSKGTLLFALPETKAFWPLPFSRPLISSRAEVRRLAGATAQGQADGSYAATPRGVGWSARRACIASPSPSPPGSSGGTWRHRAICCVNRHAAAGVGGRARLCSIRAGEVVPSGFEPFRPLLSLDGAYTLPQWPRHRLGFLL